MTSGTKCGAEDLSRRESIASLTRLKTLNGLTPPTGQHLIALDKRLNQNYFVGLAARRIQEGQVDYLEGESVWEGLQALVPRAFWPEKPVYAGSPQIVSKMTGLQLSPTRRLAWVT